MNTPSNAMPESYDEQRVVPASLSVTRPMYCRCDVNCGRNRSIYIAPLVAALSFLFGFLISMIHLPNKMRAILALDAANQHDALAEPYDAAAGLLMGTALIVGVFYCLDALHASAAIAASCLEVAAGFRSHHRALEGQHSAHVLPLYTSRSPLSHNGSCCC